MALRPENEMVDVVDDQGRTIGVVTRQEMRQQKLPHRCTYVLVFNARGELFVHLRTNTKDVYPSHWDTVIGGVVAVGETFAQGVVREIQEELGIEAEAEELFPFQYTDDASTVHGMVYLLRHEGPFVLQPEEIVRGEFMSLADIDHHAKSVPHCPDGLWVLNEYRRRYLDS